jgi:hypothetical protein
LYGEYVANNSDLIRYLIFYKNNGLITPEQCRPHCLKLKYLVLGDPGIRCGGTHQFQNGHHKECATMASQKPKPHFYSLEEGLRRKLIDKQLIKDWFDSLDIDYEQFRRQHITVSVFRDIGVLFGGITAGSIVLTLLAQGLWSVPTSWWILPIVAGVITLVGFAVSLCCRGSGYGQILGDILEDLNKFREFLEYHPREKLGEPRQVRSRATGALTRLLALRQGTSKLPEGTDHTACEPFSVMHDLVARFKHAHARKVYRDSVHSQQVRSVLHSNGTQPPESSGANSPTS